MYLRLILILSIICTSGCYDTADFQGGQIIDNGFFSYPRYQAMLGELPLNSEGQHEFNFSGLPNEEMWLQLYIQGKTHSDRNILENLSTQIHVEIMTENRRILCKATGRPADGLPNGWVLMSSAYETAFWHNNCLGLAISSNSSYVLNAKFSDIDSKSPEAQVAITIEGGGVELP